VNTRQGQIALSGNADWTQIDNWRAQIGYIETDHRRHRDPHPAAFRRNLRPPVIDLRPVGVAGQMQLSGVDIDGNFMPFDMQPSQLAMNFNGTRSTSGRTAADFSRCRPGADGR
jgi:autotransporter translocation and assembly factor TamB